MPNDLTVLNFQSLTPFEMSWYEPDLWSPSPSVFMQQRCSSYLLRQFGYIMNIMHASRMSALHSLLKCPAPTVSQAKNWLRMEGWYERLWMHLLHARSHMNQLTLSMVLIAGHLWLHPTQHRGYRAQEWSYSSFSHECFSCLPLSLH